MHTPSYTTYRTIARSHLAYTVSEVVTQPRDYGEPPVTSCEEDDVFLLGRQWVGQ